MFGNKTNSCLGIVLVAALAWSALPAAAQFGGLDKIKKAVDKGKEQLKGNEDKPAEDNKPADGQPAGSAGSIVFSAAPIDAANPSNLATSFKAGDNIYGLVRIDKTWRDLLGKGNKDATEIQVPFDMLVDGEKVDFQYITIKKAEALDGKILVFDVAPVPDKMTAYKDPGFFYAEGKGNRRIGPDQYAYNLAQLASGKHAVRFQIRSYGDVFAAGEFSIEGDDYKGYAELREKLLAEAFQAATMPKAQKTDKELEATMGKLLENAGWKNVRKLVIVDKDWWLDRSSGGDSPIVSRHIAAATATKADDGTFYWCRCTFHQRKLIDGSFGPLELTDTGEKKPILEENIDK